MQIGCMVWRIGEIIDFHEQINWLRGQAFEAVAFWTCDGRPGEWEGFDFSAATPADVARLREELPGFTSVDLHAATPLSTGPEDDGRTSEALDELQQTVAFAGQIGAATVTMHIEAPPQHGPKVHEALLGHLGSLNCAAQAAEVQVGLELTHSYDLAMQADTPHVGFTLDVGHVSFEDGAGYRDFGSISGLIDHVGRRLFHVHAHDYDDVHDHIPIGAGRIEWPPIIEALKRIDYRGVLCLELNPDRASPADILESRRRLVELVGG
jgi:sugar phosphate isomerase/epimerase